MCFVRIENDSRIISLFCFIFNVFSVDFVVIFYFDKYPICTSKTMSILEIFHWPPHLQLQCNAFIGCAGMRFEYSRSESLSCGANLTFSTAATVEEGIQVLVSWAFVGSNLGKMKALRERWRCSQGFLPHRPPLLSRMILKHRRESHQNNKTIKLIWKIPFSRNNAVPSSHNKHQQTRLGKT